MMRKTKKILAGLLLGVVLASYPIVGKTTTDRFSLLSLHSSFQPGDLFSSLGSDNLLKHQWQLWAEIDYLQRPLELTFGGITVGSVVDRLFVHHVGGAWAPTDWWNIEADFPLILKADYRNPIIPLARAASAKFTIGDIFLRQRFTILRRTEYPVGLSINPFVTLPTGQESYFVADKKPTGGLIISLDKNFGKYLSFVLNAGASTRERINFYDLDTRHQILTGGGFAIKPTSALNIKAEVASKTDLQHPFKDKLRSPTEALFGMDYKLGKGFKIAAAGGISVIRGYETPLFRAMGGLSYTSPTPYRAPREKKKRVPKGPSVKQNKALDVEGLTALNEKCLHQKEYSIKDAGCEHFERLRRAAIGLQINTSKEVSRILAGQEKDCPMDPRFYYTDTPNSICPQFYELRPKTLTELAKTPDEKEVLPYLLTTADNDDDGLPDAFDYCPTDFVDIAKDVNQDGCPKYGVVIMKGEIYTIEPVHFALNSTKLTPESKALLNAVAQVLIKHPDFSTLEVIGYADKPQKDDTISKKRAEVVSHYLQLRGVHDNLEILSLGVADNRSEKGPDEPIQKGRVEFHIQY